MKKRILMLLLAFNLSATVANGAVFEDQENVPVDDNQPALPAAVDPATHALFLESVSFAETAPDLAGISVGVRVGREWTIVDRSAEKKSPAPVSPTTLEVLNRLAGRNVSGTVTITYVRVTGYSEKGQPLYETVVFNAGGASTANDIEAQKAMNDAMGKNHK